MTISSSTNKSGPYNGNGSTTVFARTFRVLDADHLKVYQTISGVTSEVTTGISKDGIGSDSGNVTFDTAPLAGTQITLLRDIPLTQETDYSAQGKVSPVQVEDDLDLQEMQIQDMHGRVERSIKVPITSDGGFEVSEPSYGRALIGNIGEDGWEAGPNAQEIANAQSYAIRAEEALAATGGRLYESFAEAEAASVPSVAIMIWVKFNGMLLAFERDDDYSCFTDANGDSWRPHTAYPAFYEHWQIATRYIDPDERTFTPAVTVGSIMSSETDYTTQINACHSEHKGIVYVNGFVNHRQIQWHRECVVLNGAGGEFVAGFNAIYDDTIDHYHLGDIGERGFLCGNLTFYAEQPTDAASRDDLIRYPWAIKMSDSARSVPSSIRIVGYINGVDMSDSPAPSNAGGAHLEDLETMCYGIGVYINEALDYVTIAPYRSWPFMMAGFQPLVDIFSDGLTDAIRVEKCDGFIGEIATWKTRASFGRNAGTHLVLTGDVGWLTEGETITQSVSGASGVVDYIIAGPRTQVRLKDVSGSFDTTNTLSGSDTGAMAAASVPTSATSISAQSEGAITYDVNLYLDAPGSYLQLRGGKSRIKLYSSKVEEESQPTIHATFGKHFVTGDIRSSTDDAVLVDGASLLVHDAMLRSEISDVTFAKVSSGRLTIKGCQFQWPDDGLHAGIPFVEQAGGQLVVTDCDTADMQQARTAVSFSSENLFHHVSGNRFGPHEVNYSDTYTLGLYEGETKRNQTAQGNTSYIRTILSDTVTNARNEVTRRARGVKGAITKVIVGVVVKNWLFQVWTGSGWQNLMQDRTKVLAESGGVSSGVRDVFVADSSGVLQHVTSHEAARFVSKQDARVEGDLDVTGSATFAGNSTGNIDRNFLNDYETARDA